MNDTTATSNIAGAFLSDKDLAEVLGMSQSWVRKQRHLRARGQDHVLTLNPVYLGKSPRYRQSEFSEWFNQL
jgi:predicted DNA-binding transcriptional regulator AlpA